MNPDDFFAAVARRQGEVAAPTPQGGSIPVDGPDHYAAMPKQGHIVCRSTRRDMLRREAHKLRVEMGDEMEDE